MVFHMKKTTLNIPDQLYRRVKRRAAEQGRTVSELVSEYLHRGLTAPVKADDLPPLPAYDMGDMLVDISSRRSWYDALDED
jgi:hypothetical protein